MSVQCPKCQQINEDSAEVCTFCGAALVIAVLTSSGSDMVPDAPQQALSTSRCPKHPAANIQLKGGKLVCSECGYELGSLEPKTGVSDVVEQEQVAPREGRAAYLDVEGGQEVFFRGAYTTKIPFKGGPILIGRRDVMASHYPDVDLMMYRKLDPAISRRHLRLFKEGKSYYVEDLCNNNATFLNDYNNKLNHERRELHHGDRIFVSMSLALVFRLHD